LHINNAMRFTQGCQSATLLWSRVVSRGVRGWLVHPSIRVSTFAAQQTANGCGLIQRCDESHSGLRVFILRVATSFSSSQSVSELALSPLEPGPGIMPVGL